MNEADLIYDQESSIMPSLWGINEIPFCESASHFSQSLSLLGEVFTGREAELREVFNLFMGRERKSLLVYGWMGIGKTAFILEVLGVLRRKAKDTLTTYISLPAETDLGTAAFIALAREMEDDEWAQHQLNQMGLRPRKPARKRKSRIKSDAVFIGTDTEEESIPVASLQFPTLSFEDLLERALKKYKKVVVAIDDLDKQDPSRVRELLRNAQGMLKGGAWFMLTGHPSGLTRDILTRDLGLFDLPLKLEKLDQATTHRMLCKYLNSARAKNAKRDLEDRLALRPFTPESAQMLCERSDGVPRWLNRLGSYVMRKAAQLRVETISIDVLTRGLEYADHELRGQSGLTPEDHYVLELVLERGILSDENINLVDLDPVRAKEFSEILPILDRLVQLDLLRRLPTERASEYTASPMLLGKPRADK